MMSNIFFYGVDLTAGNQSTSFIFGPISFSLAEICVGVISSLMVLPANLLVIQMFRLSRPIPEKIKWFSWFKRKKKKTREEEEKELEEKILQVKRDKEERMDEKAVTELEEQLQALDGGDEDDMRKILKSAQSRRLNVVEGGKDETEAGENVNDEMMVSRRYLKRVILFHYCDKNSSVYCKQITMYLLQQLVENSYWNFSKYF